MTEKQKIIHLILLELEFIVDNQCFDDLNNLTAYDVVKLVSDTILKIRKRYGITAEEIRKELSSKDVRK